ncbi:uncharacterized protein RB166_021302 [Leptodactylus fuscus]|uniref:uncharacterized protein LOC142187871 n=1 Tax=Leptodactylus fuscus TaxID=238119 RepID=UPI003F4F0EB2
MKLSRLDDPTESLSMDKTRKQMIERIVHIALDILYLLTGEDYVVLKMSGGRVTHSSSPIVSGGFCRKESKDPKRDPMIEDGRNEQKILELTQTITHLLTGEVPIRCQDVTVYFSMEESDDLERPNSPTREEPPQAQQHRTPDGAKNKEPYEKSPPAVTTEEAVAPQCPLLSEIPTDTTGTQTMIVKEEETYEMAEHSTDSTGTSSNRSSPEKLCRPPSPEDSSEDDDEAPQDEQCDDLDDLKIEIKSLEDGEEMSKWDDEQCKEEDVPKKRRRGRTCKTTLTEKVKSDREEGAADERRDLPRRAKHPLTAVIEVDEEEMARLQRAAEWEIHEDGSTHLMASGGPSDCKRRPPVPPSTPPDSKAALSDLNAHPCSECDKCFSEVSHLESHRKVHAVPALFSCAECGKNFTTSSELGKHIKVHTEEKLFACSECGKCFTVKSNLLAHKAVHTGEKPFACAECGRRFALKSSLETHMLVHALEKPYACSICGKCFTSSARLAYHQTTHIGEKTYECEECGKVFTASGSLNRHKRTHTGEKPYACRICGKCFNRETNLYRHQMIHTR